MVLIRLPDKSYLYCTGERLTDSGNKGASGGTAFEKLAISVVRILPSATPMFPPFHPPAIIY